MVERAIYAEGEFEELLVKYQDMWEYLDEVSEHEQVALLARKQAKSSQCGGGWSPTAARLP